VKFLPKSLSTVSAARLPVREHTKTRMEWAEPGLISQNSYVRSAQTPTQSEPQRSERYPRFVSFCAKQSWISRVSKATLSVDHHSSESCVRFGWWLYADMRTQLAIRKVPAFFSRVLMPFQPCVGKMTGWSAKDGSPHLQSGAGANMCHNAGTCAAEEVALGDQRVLFRDRSQLWPYHESVRRCRTCFLAEGTCCNCGSGRVES
jgi:hypothetical protein